MIVLKTFLIIWGAMIATSFWEAYVEGKCAWEKGKLGWKIKVGKHTLLTAYHFYLFFIMFPLLVFVLPLTLMGFSWKLFGILLSAYSSGIMLEDFFWFVVNPTFKLKNFGSKHVKWYPWIKIDEFEIPAYYILDIGIAVLSWLFLWKGF